MLTLRVLWRCAVPLALRAAVGAPNAKNYATSPAVGTARRLVSSSLRSPDLRWDFPQAGFVHADRMWLLGYSYHSSQTSLDLWQRE